MNLFWFLYLSAGVALLCFVGLWLFRPKAIRPEYAIAVIVAVVIASTLAAWNLDSYGPLSAESNSPHGTRSTATSQEVGGGTPVVVLDAAGLAERFYERASHAGEVSSPVDVAQDFAAQLARVLRDYEGAGILVLNKNATLAVPPLRDVTTVVAERLGLGAEK
ncbi:hypothetical protein KYT87_22080 [Achromobacter sp. ES-001]|uniref:hypothetical protein n=1 Tax=Achromobacter sp. ES-001 TaxID=2860286 RepID=UPI001C64354C|nr:hypothetical protein [Achromobacter sp. ES-001]QYJ20333.1 hypothetical protein KYT87_22080 [Achromobacter sp. ES-001]